MYEEAVQGTLPVLPGIVIPSDLDQATVLKILGEMNEEKVKLFKGLFDDQASSVHGSPAREPREGFAVRLQEANDQAEKTILDKTALIAGDVCLFQSAIAKHMSSESFRNKKADLERSYQLKIMEAMRSSQSAANNNSSGSSVSTVAANESESGKSPRIVEAVSYDKIERTSAEDLEVQWSSAKDTNTTMVCLMIDETKKQHTDVLSKFDSDIAKLTGELAECTYLYILMSEAAKCSIEEVSSFARSHPEQCPSFVVFAKEHVTIVSSWEEATKVISGSGAVELTALVDSN